MANLTKTLWFGLTLVMFAVPARAADDLYASQIVEQARQWQQKNRDDLAADVWRKLLLLDPRHPEALVKLGIIEAGAGKLGQAEALLRRATQLSPAPGNLRDLSDAVRAAKGSPPDAAPPQKESQRKPAVLPEPTVREVPARSLSGSQPRKSGPTAPAKLSKSKGQPPDTIEATKPRAAGETELNFSSALDPIQAKPRP